MQTVAGRELKEVGHRSPHEMGMWRPAIASAIDVGFHNLTVRTNIIAIDTRSMVFVLANDVKATNRGAISFAATRYSGRCGSVSSAIEISFLSTEIDDN